MVATNVDLERLKQVKTIVSHADCADGIASAMICAHALDWRPEVKFMHYNSPELKALKAEPGMLFVDFSPPPDRIPEFINAKTIVLDHHKGADGVLQHFIAAGLGAFADEKEDPGISGASLAYSEVLTKLSVGPNHDAVKRFARLCGIRDTWQTSDSKWREACGVALALKFLGFEGFKSKKQANLNVAEVELADILITKHEQKIAKHVEENVIVRGVAGYRIAFHYDTGGLTSDVAEAMRAQDVPITIGFFYAVENHQPKLIMSTRSDGSFNVAKFCKYYGGGGHTRAAGFSQALSDDPTKRWRRPLGRDPFGGEQNPWYFAQSLFDRYVSQLSTEKFAPGV